MKVIIAGSRNISDYDVVELAVLQSKFQNITEVVSGCARGVDFLGEQWALNNNIPIRSFPAEWGLYGKSAGYIRNGKMAQYADALIAVWDGKSRGTANMIKLAKERQLLVYVLTVLDVSEDKK